MSCGRITAATGVGSGVITAITCCTVETPLWFHYSGGFDDEDIEIGPVFEGTWYAGDDNGGGGGNYWSGDADHGGGGGTIGDDDDPGDNWWDGDADWGGGGDGLGGDDDPPNCLAYGTMVTLFDGSMVSIESLRVGDELASVVIDSMQRDAHHGQYHLHEKKIGDGVGVGVVADIIHGWHSGSYTINGAITATFEHPFLIRRGSYYGFSPAESLRLGDMLQYHGREVEIESIVKSDKRLRTVSLYIPGLNTFMASGMWVHNANYKIPPFGGDVGSGDDPGDKDSGGFGSF